MREPIREPNPQEGHVPRGPEPLRYSAPTPVGEAYARGVARLVEWAPTWGGMFVSLGVLLLLSSLGLAIGIGTGATAAGIWGAISVIIGFFVGGWFTGRTLEVFDPVVAAAHGILMWAVAIVFTLLFTVFGAIVGLNSLANARLAFVGNALGPLGYSGAPASAAATANAAVTSSWITFLVLLLSVIAAVIGALIGNQGRIPGVTPHSHP